MSIRTILKCRSCGFEIDAGRSDRSIPEACPSCGRRELEFQVSFERVTRGDEVGVEPILSEAFIKQVAQGEYLIDISATDDVAIAELEPGVYEIIIKTSRSSSRSR